MRILQVVAYISPDGAYGGPVRVAINQAKALTDLGHDVVVAAAAGGFEGSLPTEFDGFPIRLFPARRVVPKSGFAGLTSPSLIKWLIRAIRGADVIHVHLARDLVTLPSAALALMANKSLVVQTHGMIDRSANPLAWPLDRLLTLPVLRRAKTILYLTERERRDLETLVGARIRLTHLPNGVIVPKLMAVEQQVGTQSEPEVLYLARLHAIKRPTLMVEAAKDLLEIFPRAQFTLVGPDEGMAQKLKATITAERLNGNVKWAGPLPPEQTISRMAEASVYALPSSVEVFPMSVLEAMSVGLPVVVTDGCGLASAISSNAAGVVCNQSPSDFAQAIRTLLQDSDARITMGLNARAMVEKDYSIRRVADNLVSIYKSTDLPKKAYK